MFTYFIVNVFEFNINIFIGSFHKQSGCYILVFCNETKVVVYIVCITFLRYVTVNRGERVVTKYVTVCLFLWGGVLGIQNSEKCINENVINVWTLTCHAYMLYGKAFITLLVNKDCYLIYVSFYFVFLGLPCYFS